MAGTSLSGRVAVVTGSTGGIGHGLAWALAPGGAAILLNGFGDAAAIKAPRAGLKATYGVTAGGNPAETSKPAEIAGLIDAAGRGLDGVHVVANNAGMQFTAPIQSFPTNKWDAVTAINPSAAFHATQPASPVMKQAGSDVAATMTGTTLPIDDGWVAG